MSIGAIFAAYGWWILAGVVVIAVAVGATVLAERGKDTQWGEGDGDPTRGPRPDITGIGDTPAGEGP